jgi:hypothetical protein
MLLFTKIRNIIYYSICFDIVVYVSINRFMFRLSPFMFHYNCLYSYIVIYVSLSPVTFQIIVTNKYKNVSFLICFISILVQLLYINPQLIMSYVPILLCFNLRCSYRILMNGLEMNFYVQVWDFWTICRAREL